MKTFRSLFAKTFVCPCCKRELSKEYLFARGLCINCVMNSYKRNKPEPAIPIPEEAPKETFVCPNCKRELNKKYLYKQGMCVDCVANSQKHDKPGPTVPTPEGKFVCRNCKRELNKKYLYKRGLCVDCITNPQKYGKSVLTSSAPGKMALPGRIKFEEGLGISSEDRFVYMRGSGEYRKRERIEGYLGNDNLKSYMMETVVDQYSTYRSEAEMLHPPMTFTSVTVDETIRLLNELYSSSKGQQLGIKSRYIEALKNLLQSDDKLSYYTALDYIYNHLWLEINDIIKLKLLSDTDNAELYKIFKDSIPKHIDFLKARSVFKAEQLGCTLYEFAQEIDKMFCSISK